MWFIEEFRQGTNGNVTWKEVKGKFLAHFSDPNQESLLTKELHSITVASMGGSLQRYTDRFLYLCAILKQSMDSESLIRCYKEGLPVWIQKSLNNLQASYVLCHDPTDRLTVRELGRADPPII